MLLCRQRQESVIVLNRAFNLIKIDNFILFKDYTCHHELLDYCLHSQLEKAYDNFRRPSQQAIEYDQTIPPSAGLCKL